MRGDQHTGAAFDVNAVIASCRHEHARRFLYYIKPILKRSDFMQNQSGADEPSMNDVKYLLKAEAMSKT